jgi:hypothetical protein
MGARSLEGCRSDCPACVFECVSRFVSRTARQCLAGQFRPVFDGILEKARSVCDSAHGTLFLRDGNHLRAAGSAARADPEAPADPHRAAPGASAAVTATASWSAIDRTDAVSVHIHTLPAAKPVVPCATSEGCGTIERPLPFNARLSAGAAPEGEAANRDQAAHCLGE